MDIDYSLLETQGYVVIPNFLNQKEINFFRKDYETSAPDGLVEYKLRKVSPKIFRLLDKKLNNTIDTIKNVTQLTVDLIIPFARYYDSEISPMTWYHQDHESFYILQQYYHYLNFWIPITKPDANKSGLKVIPFDKLKELAPEYFDKIVNYGATRYFPNGDTTKFIDNNNGQEFDIPINLDSIAESPALNAGDVLLLRGDTIHKTQDCDTKRLAITIRCTNGSSPISKTKLLEYGCKIKQDKLTNAKFMVDRALEIFESSGRDTISGRDYYATALHQYQNTNRYKLL
jgi:hypothetical protein